MIGDVLENARKRVQRGRPHRRALLSCHCPPQLAKLACIPPPATRKRFFVFLPPGQFLLEQARLGEAAEMAERAAELDSSEFDVVFSAAHMLRWGKPRRAASKAVPATESIKHR